jgi:pyruvate,water dikinase
MRLTPLAQATNAARFGEKAAALARALSAGLPVPRGFALDIDVVEVFAGDRALAVRELEQCRDLQASERWAVRSSAVGEDSCSASFAGQHLTRLGVRTLAGLAEAICEVHASVSAPSALAYRAKQHVPGPARTGIVLQRLIAADVAGVLFTRNPMTGADELLIEASWGLGEAVVSGSVTPDRFRLSRSGRLLERTLGEKEVRLLLRGDDVVETETAPIERARSCLADTQLQQLHAQVSALDELWPGPHDVEFAFCGDELFVLQRRPLTTG